MTKPSGSTRPRKKPGPRGPGFLFPDAEMREDVAEDVVGVHGARDFTEVVKGLSCIHRHEVSRDAVAESVAHGLEGGLG